MSSERRFALVSAVTAAFLLGAGPATADKLPGTNLNLGTEAEQSLKQQQKPKLPDASPGKKKAVDDTKTKATEIKKPDAPKKPKAPAVATPKPKPDESQDTPEPSQVTAPRLNVPEAGLSDSEVANTPGTGSFMDSEALDKASHATVDQLLEQQLVDESQVTTDEGIRLPDREAIQGAEEAKVLEQMEEVGAAGQAAFGEGEREILTKFDPNTAPGSAGSAADAAGLSDPGYGDQAGQRGRPVAPQWARHTRLTPDTSASGRSQRRSMGTGVNRYGERYTVVRYGQGGTRGRRGGPTRQETEYEVVMHEEGGGTDTTFYDEHWRATSFQNRGSWGYSEGEYDDQGRVVSIEDHTNGTRPHRIEWDYDSGVATFYELSDDGEFWEYVGQAPLDAQGDIIDNADRSGGSRKGGGEIVTIWNSGSDEDDGGGAPVSVLESDHETAHSETDTGSDAGAHETAHADGRDTGGNDNTGGTDNANADNSNSDNDNDNDTKSQPGPDDETMPDWAHRVLAASARRERKDDRRGPYVDPDDPTSDVQDFSRQQHESVLAIPEQVTQPSPDGSTEGGGGGTRSGRASDFMQPGTDATGDTGTTVDASGPGIPGMEESTGGGLVQPEGDQ